MAKKPKRVDGVSNRKVARPRRERPAGAERNAPARRGRTALKAEARPDARDRVEKKRGAASSRAGREDPGVAAVRVPRRAGKPAAVAAARPSKHVKDGNGADDRSRGPSKERRKQWSVSPRIVVVAILLAVFIALSASPVARNIEATGQLRAMERELEGQMRTTKRLESEVQQARSLEYIEQEARRQRLVAPGEVLYLVTTDAEGPDVEYRVKAFQSMDEVWERVRRMLHCTAERQAGGR